MTYDLKPLKKEYYIFRSKRKKKQPFPFILIYKNNEQQKNILLKIFGHAWGLSVPSVSGNFPILRDDELNAKKIKIPGSGHDSDPVCKLLFIATAVRSQ